MSSLRFAPEDPCPVCKRRGGILYLEDGLGWLCSACGCAELHIRESFFSSSREQVPIDVGKGEKE